MVERADAILAAIPVLLAGGFAIRGAIVATGVGTGLLAAPIGAIGTVVAFVVVLYELVWGPTATETDG